MKPKKQQALETFNWWISHAKEYYASTHHSGSRKISYLVQCRLQQAAEYTFKAIITSLSSRELKTSDPYILIRHALQYIPEISLVFPRDQPIEKEIFHYLKPAFLLERGLPQLLPDDEKLSLLAKRICQLITIVETEFRKKIASL